MFIAADVQTRIIKTLIDTHGIDRKGRIEAGVAQAAAFWTEKDGAEADFESFCQKNFIADEKQLDETFDRIDRNFESINGHLNSISQDLRQKIDLDLGEITPLDMLWGSYDVSAHLAEDLFDNKVAFIILLNYPQYGLESKRREGENWQARDWAIARLGDMFCSRVPAEINQEMARVGTAAETYISEYNIFMGNLRDRANKSHFPEELKLISHWGLRDELKCHYGQKDAADKQELIFEVMNRIVTQEIPERILNNSELTWNPYDNLVSDGQPPTAEPDRRYQHILNIFQAGTKVDPYYPDYPTYIKRRFELAREMTEGEVESIFDDCLTAPQLKEVGQLISSRLGRNLRPYDIWYDGFKSRSSIAESDLDRKVTEKYPNLEAYQNDLQNILLNLDFTKEQAEFVVPKITVDASRGPGHAWGSDMKAGIAHLRTRVPQGGMDYKGYNIATHEFGHTVEQTLSIQKVDYHLMHGVPFSGFSEAFAFIFQSRDLELLGIKNDDPQAEQMMALDRFWSSCEIMAVALVDMKVWNWLYANPKAAAADLKKAVIDFSRAVWNKYFAKAFGSKDEIILGIYSHMINYPLYLAEYPLGHVIEFQIEKHMQGKKL
ncbi:MAG: hypothetical protein GY841_01815, partial [FCB group bacterium]|nr:hypothetical protein [FCB group bacterium]